MQEGQQEFLNLDNIGGGAARELFQEKLERVIENILDPNTDDTKARTITITVTITPSKNSVDFCTADVKCDAKLSTAREFPTQMYIGKVNGRYQASEYNQQQLSLFQNDNILTIHKRTEGEHQQ